MLKKEIFLVSTHSSLHCVDGCTLDTQMCTVSVWMGLNLVMINFLNDDKMNFIMMWFFHHKNYLCCKLNNEFFVFCLIRIYFCIIVCDCVCEYVRRFSNVKICLYASITQKLHCLHLQFCTCSIINVEECRLILFFLFHSLFSFISWSK